MKEKKFLLELFIITLIFLGITYLLNIQSPFLIYSFIAIVLIAILITQILKLYLRYLTTQYYKVLKKDFELVTQLHRAKYKSYFIDDNKVRLQKCSESFEAFCNKFIDDLEKEETKKLVKFTKKQYQVLEKMLKKAKEMKENTFIADYSI